MTQPMAVKTVTKLSNASQMRPLLKWTHLLRHTANVTQVTTLTTTQHKHTSLFMDATTNILTVFVLNKFSTLAKNLVAVVTVSLDALNSQLSIEHTKKHHQDFRSNTILTELKEKYHEHTLDFWSS